MNPGRKKTVRRKDSLFSTTCERSGNVMKICVNLMPALALSKDPLDPEEVCREHRHRLILKEEKRIPTAINEDRNPEKDKPSGRPVNVKRSVLTFNGATRVVRLNPVFVLPPIAKSNSTLWRRPVHYDHAKTVVSAAPPNPGGAALSSHDGVSSRRGVSSLGGVYDMGSVYTKGWVSDQGGVSSQGMVNDQSGVCSLSGVSSQSGVYDQSGVSSQGVAYDQSGVSSQTGLYDQSGVSDHSGLPSQSGVYNQGGVYDQTAVYDQGISSLSGVSSQGVVSSQSGVSDQSGVSEQGRVSSHNAVCGQGRVFDQGVSSKSEVSNPGGVIEQDERARSCEYTASPTDGPPDTSLWTDRTLPSQCVRNQYFHIFQLPRITFRNVKSLLFHRHDHNTHVSCKYMSGYFSTL